jgi:hypothetical protein
MVVAGWLLWSRFNAILKRHSLLVVRIVHQYTNMSEAFP